jgi:hypothetical protein
MHYAQFVHAGRAFENVGLATLGLETIGRRWNDHFQPHVSAADAGRVIEVKKLFCSTWHFHLLSLS